MSSSTVLLRKGALGDVVLLGSVASTISGHVTVVTDARWRQVAERLTGVDAVIEWPNDPSVLPDGRVVDLQGNIRSRRLARGRAAHRLNKRSLRRRARLLVPALPARPSVPTIYAQACQVPIAPLPWITLPRSTPNYLGIVPGAAWRTKTWAWERYVQLGCQWRGGVRVFGGPGEEAMCQAIVDGIPEAELVVERGFHQTFEAFQDTAVVVGGDTGLVHLAGACGLPVVVLFGPTHREDGFFCYPGRYLQRSLFCRPCSLHGRDRCPLVVQRCMEHSVDAVLAAVMEARCVG